MRPEFLKGVTTRKLTSGWNESGPMSQQRQSPSAVYNILDHLANSLASTW